MAEPKKRLYRSVDDKMVAGVCGGIAEYFNIDATLVRIALVVVALISGGAGILAYIVMWIVMPMPPGDDEVPADDDLEVRAGAAIDDAKAWAKEHADDV